MSRKAIGSGTNRGVYSEVSGGTKNYGYIANTPGGATDLSFYVPNGDGDAAFLDNLLVGGLAETLTNSSFATSGDDLFVAGMAGIKGNVYTDGEFIAGATTALGDGGSYGYVSSSHNLSLISNNVTSRYIYLYATAPAQDPSIYWEGIAAADDPGLRANAATGDMEYRDGDGSCDQYTGSCRHAGANSDNRRAGIYPGAGHDQHGNRA